MSDWWIVTAPTAAIMVQAGSEKQAKEVALRKTGFEHKPYLARTWIARPATMAERKRHAAQMDFQRTLKSTLSKSKSARDRLTKELPE